MAACHYPDFGFIASAPAPAPASAPDLVSFFWPLSARVLRSVILLLLTFPALGFPHIVQPCLSYIQFSIAFLSSLPKHKKKS